MSDEELPNTITDFLTASQLALFGSRTLVPIVGETVDPLLPVPTLGTPVCLLLSRNKAERARAINSRNSTEPNKLSTTFTEVSSIGWPAIEVN